VGSSSVTRWASEVATPLPRRLAPEPVAGAQAEEALLATIAESPGDPSAYLVYADWLMARGDPRGQLIGLQHALADAKASEALREEESRLLAEHEATLLGPLAEHATDVRFRLGFARYVRLQRRGPLPLDEVVRQVLAHPTARLLEDLAIGVTSHGDDHPGYGPTLLALAESSSPSLACLRLGDSHTPLGDVSNVFRIFPRLRTVALSGTGLRLSAISPDGLRELVLSNVDTSGAVARAIAAASFPSLETLVFRRTFSFGPYVDELLDALEPPLVPKLSWLFVRASHLRYGERAVSAVLRAPVLGQLERLDLDLPLCDDDLLELIAAAEALSHLRQLRLRAGNDVSPELQAELDRRVPSAAWSTFVASVPGEPPSP
jgi:uncharacterized protein (TIGR02996 family)